MKSMYVIVFVALFGVILGLVCASAHVKNKDVSKLERITAQTKSDDNCRDSLYLGNNCYIVFEGAVYGRSKCVVEGADAATFEKLDLLDFAGNFRGYYKDKNHIYNCYSKNGQNSINNSDSATFQIIDDDFAKDKNNVYYDTMEAGAGYSFFVIKNVDVNNIEVLHEKIVRDKDHVYYVNIVSDRAEIIENADPNTFEIIEFPYSRDKNHIFYTSFTEAKLVGIKVLEGADPSTFKVIDFPFSKDKNRIFYKYRSFDKIDLDTFQIIGGRYVKDDKNAYYCNGRSNFGPECYVVEDVDLNTFEKIDIEQYGGYLGAKDKNNIYSGGVAIQNSDPATFEVTNYFNSARDKEYSYKINCASGECLLEVLD